MRAQAEYQPFLELAAEINRRILADAAPEPNALVQWIITAAGRLGGDAAQGAILEWQESLDYFNELMERRKERAALPESERRELRWAWRTWNQYIDPPDGGMLAVLAGADGAGKTLYAETQAESWAKQGFRVAYFHYELNRALMVDRRASRAAAVPRRNIKNFDLSGPELERLAAAEQMLRAFPGEVNYIHSPGWTAERTIQVARRMVANDKCDVVIIDYLEKVEPSEGVVKRYHSKNQYEAATVEAFKNFAEMAGIPVLLVSQLNKAGKQTRSRDIDRTAIRGAGEKTEKANVVVLISRGKDEETGDYVNVVDVRIDKNTMGPTGSFQQYMHPEFFRVADFVD